MKIRFDLEIISRSRSVVVLLSFLFFPSLFLFHFEISSRGNPWTFRVRLFPAACIMHAPHPCTPQHSLLHLLLLPSQGEGCDTLFAAVGPRTSCSFHSWPTPLVPRDLLHSCESHPPDTRPYLRPSSFRLNYDHFYREFSSLIFRPWKSIPCESWLVQSSGTLLYAMYYILVWEGNFNGD